MPNLTCPECSAETFVDDADGWLNGAPDEFCRKCDFPLFWAPREVIEQGLIKDEVRLGVGADQPRLRRLPGTEGLESSTGVVCPTCHELNDPSHELCWRCGNPLELIEEEIVVEEEVVVEVELDVPPVKHYWDPPSWLLVTLGVILAALVVFLAIAVL